jgi:hypothetical protein
LYKYEKVSKYQNINQTNIYYHKIVPIAIQLIKRNGKNNNKIKKNNIPVLSGFSSGLFDESVGSTVNRTPEKHKTK